MDDDGRPGTSRRLVLGALPLAALAGACALPPKRRESQPDVPSPPDPKTPDEAIAVLMAGNARFAALRPAVRSVVDIELLWRKVVTTQKPFAMVLGCADSRLSPEIIFDQFVGDVFVVREAGNIAESPTNLGSLEYGQAMLGAKALVVLGHSDCGAVNAAFTDATPGGNIAAIVDAIRPGVTGAADLDDAVVRNVQAVIDRVRRNSPVLRDAENSGAFRIAGAYYDIETSTVRMV